MQEITGLAAFCSEKTCDNVIKTHNGFILHNNTLLLAELYGVNISFPLDTNQVLYSW